MTARAVLCRFLLEGRVLTIMNCFREVGFTNLGREIPRVVEKPFGVEVSRTQCEGKSRYGQKTTYFSYRLNKTEYNEPGIKKMWEYVNANWGDNPPKNPVGRPETVIPSGEKPKTLFDA